MSIFNTNLYESLENDKTKLTDYVQQNMEHNFKKIYRLISETSKHPEKYPRLYKTFQNEIYAFSQGLFNKSYYNNKIILDDVMNSINKGYDVSNYIKTLDNNQRKFFESFIKAPNLSQWFYNKMGANAIQFLPAQDRLYYYKDLIVNQKQLDIALNAIEKNETIQMRQQLLSALSKDNVVDNAIKEHMYNELRLNRQFITNNQEVFFQAKDTAEKLGLQGWKLHVAADNVLDYYRLYRSIKEDMDNGVEVSLKFINPYKFYTDEQKNQYEQLNGRTPNLYGKELTIYLGQNANIDNFSEKTYKLLYEVSQRHAPNDKIVAPRITARYGQFNPIQSNIIYKPDGNITNDTRYGNYKPDFIKEETLTDILSVSKQNKNILEQTGDFEAYLQNAILGTISQPSDSYLYTTIIVDKNNLKNLQSQLGYSFTTATGQTAPICYINVDNYAVAYTFIQNKKDFENIKKEVMQNLPVYSTEQQHKTLRQNLDPTFINTQNITQKLTREQLNYDFAR